eukprot:jgi/Mesen1/4519/ME000023S03888
MSTFLRKWFGPRPPDGLLQITDRVYAFDSCFSTDVFDDETYRIYMRQIVTQLHEQFPGSSFLVFNFREGEKKSALTDILSQYDMTVMDYPRQYEGCPIISMEMTHHFLRSSDSWLNLEGSKNFVLMHCERGGWPLLAFMISAFLIFRKEFTGEEKTLQTIHKEGPKGLLQLLSPLSPIPSQLRYLAYVSGRNNTSKWPPEERTLLLDCLIMRTIPSFDNQGGCRPILRVYGTDPTKQAGRGRSTDLLYAMTPKSKNLRYYRQIDSEVVKIDIQCAVQGDVVLECIHYNTEAQREEMMFRVMFNTAFIRSNMLMLSRDDIDILWNSKERFVKTFRSEILLADLDTTHAPQNNGGVPEFVNGGGGEEKGGLPVEAFNKLQELFSSADWNLEEDSRDALEQIRRAINDANNNSNNNASTGGVPHGHHGGHHGGHGYTNGQSLHSIVSAGAGERSMGGSSSSDRGHGGGGGGGGRPARAATYRRVASAAALENPPSWSSADEGGLDDDDDDDFGSISSMSSPEEGSPTYSTYSQHSQGSAGGGGGGGGRFESPVQRLLRISSLDLAGRGGGGGHGHQSHPDEFDP